MRETAEVGDKHLRCIHICTAYYAVLLLLLFCITLIQLFHSEQNYNERKRAKDHRSCLLLVSIVSLILWQWMLAVHILPYSNVLILMNNIVRVFLCSFIEVFFWYPVLLNTVFAQTTFVRVLVSNIKLPIYFLLSISFYTTIWKIIRFIV